MNTVRYLEADAAWLVEASAAGDIEVLVGGSPSAANPQRLSLLEGVVNNLPDVERKAVAYLDEFVDRQAFASGNQWLLEGVSSLSPSNSEVEFNAQFSIEGDTYGLWNVTFKCELGKYWPVAFCRRNC